ncbi:MAG: carboxypeptidase-like regulatory domain-containing protein [Bacteroidota bacterium]
MYGRSKSSFPWLRAAVMIVLLAGAGLLSYQFFFTDESGKISQLSKEENAVAKTKEPVATQPGMKTDTSVSTNAVSAPTANVNPGKISEPGALADSKQNAGNTTELPKNDLSKTNTEKTAPPAIMPDAAVPDDKKRKEGISKSQETVIVADKNNSAIKDNEFAFKKKAVSEDIQLREQRAATAPSASAKQTDQGYYNNNINYFRGRVTDANNNPLPFSNVTNATDNVGTYSDAKGYFTLVSTDSVMDVQIRSLGFENNRSRLRSDLNSNQVMLQEDRSISAKILDTVKRNYAIRSRDGNLTFEEPEPADGWASYDTYLANNLNVPENFDVKKNESSDAVELSFEVNKYGDPVNIRVEKSLCDKCDKEAIRLVKDGPKWKRKAKKGKRTTVKVPFIKAD